MKTIVITGGAGFLGFNLLKKLVSLKCGDRYIVVDNFITSNPVTIRNYINNNKLTLLETDICFEQTIRAIKDALVLSDTSLLEIYHLASLASPPFYKRFPIETLDVGYTGMKNLLELCVWCQPKGIQTKLLYTSTSEVYGDALEHPQRESYYGNVNSFGERSCYDIGKRIGETLIYTYNKLYGLDTRIVRIFNTYGPHMSIGDGRIVTEIMRCMILGKPLTIFGDGNQTRSLAFVDDTLSMLLMVMDTDYFSPVNIGNEHEVTINQLVEISRKVYERQFQHPPNFEVIHTAIDKDDPKVRRPDLSLYRSITNSEPPSTPLESGLLRTLLYFQELVDHSL
jgi:UDP-glucuronate decarboxylase